MTHRMKIKPQSSFWGFAGISTLFVLLLLTPGILRSAAQDALQLCGRVMIPSLFPFLVISDLFTRRNYQQYFNRLLRPCMQPLFGVPADGASALVLGAIGGYPIGAATVFNLYDKKKLSAEDSSRLLMFCNNAGPAYILGVVGAGMFQNMKTGVLIYAVHLISACMIGIFSRAQRRNPPRHDIEASSEKVQEITEPFAISFVEAVRKSTLSILNICAFIIFFSVILALFSEFIFALSLVCLSYTNIPEQLNILTTLTSGIVELSTGINYLSATGSDPAVLAAISVFLLGWGGICVHCQVLSLRGSRRISMRPYFLGKLFQGLLSSILCLLILHDSIHILLIAAVAVLVMVRIRLKSKKVSGKEVYHRV